MHAAALVGAVTVFCTWHDIALCLAMHALRMYMVGAIFHRYFSHRSFRTSRPVQFLFAFVATSSTQQGPLWWASRHRLHHRHSDQPTDDHSPHHGGLFWAHIGWICSTRCNETSWTHMKDFSRYPELRWLNRFHLVPSILLAVTLLAVGGIHALVWGFFVSVVISWHCTFSLTSLCHRFGRRRFETRDDSRNNAFVALVTLGEGWHNNHHHRPRLAKHGHGARELDPIFWGLRVLERFGLIWDLRMS